MRVRELLAGVLAAVGLAMAATPAVAAEPEQKLPFPVTGSKSTDTGAVTLGVKFTVAKAGKVIGVEFHRTDAQNPARAVQLWNQGGTLVATAQTPSATTTGWNRATFSSPAAVKAGETLTASYQAPQGRYTNRSGGFNTARVAGDVRAPVGAGVYRYGSTARFPTSAFSNSDYYVTPVFVADAASPPTPSTSSPPPPPGSANCSTSQVWQSLDACGWPGPSTTGYPAGQVFGRTVTGGLTVTVDGAVIDGYKISGGVQVRAQNVVIRNSWVTNSAAGKSGSGVININPGFSATIERNLLDGQASTHTCIWHEGRSMTARANNCQAVNDGIFSWATQPGVDGTGDNFLIENNWLHSFVESAANGHVDAYQTEGAKHGVIRHNTIDVTQDQTSAIGVWNGRKSSDDILVDNNLLSGGGFTVYAEDYSPSEASPAGGYSVTNTSFTNNRFSTVHYGCVGIFGVWFPRGAPTDGWRRTGNTVLETGQNVDAGNPTFNGRTCN